MISVLAAYLMMSLAIPNNEDQYFDRDFPMVYLLKITNLAAYLMYSLVFHLLKICIRITCLTVQNCKWLSHLIKISILTAHLMVQLASHLMVQLASPSHGATGFPI